MGRVMEPTDPQWRDRAIPGYLLQALQALEEKRKTHGWNPVIHLDYVALDAAVMTHLWPDYDKPELHGIEIKRTSLTYGSTIYGLRHQELGQLGAIELRSLGNSLTELTMMLPQAPELHRLTPDEAASILALSNDTTRRAYNQSLTEQREAEREAHYQWKKAIYAAVLTDFFTRYKHEREQLKTISTEQIPSDLAPLTYDSIIEQAQARAAKKGLTAEDHPIGEWGAIEIAEWFLAFWVPLGRSLEKYTELFDDNSRTIRRHWEHYRAMHNLPTLQELGRMRRRQP